MTCIVSLEYVESYTQHRVAMYSLHGYPVLHRNPFCNARNVKFFNSWNSKSIWNIPSILTCAIITLHKHHHVSVVCACMTKQQRCNFGVKTYLFSLSSPCKNHPTACVVCVLPGSEVICSMLLIGWFFCENYFFF